jgi:hypothetical protein
MRLPERWGPFHGVEGLPHIIVLSNALVYAFDLLRPGLMGDLLLIPSRVHASGEWWRLVTFLFVPPPLPETWPVLWLVVWLMVLHNVATALENAWGAFRFTVYFFSGALATALVAVLPFPAVITNGYLQGSLFLAFSTLFPDETFLLFFILPVRAKWLAVFTAAAMGWAFLAGGLAVRLTVAASLVNYGLLLGPGLCERWRLWREVRRNRRRWPGD